MNKRLPRWNVVADVNGTKVKIVSRGNTKEEATHNAFANYSGITRIISITEREVKATFPISESALRLEPYEFRLRSEIKRQAMDK